ncbi:glycosyltransferase [Alicyclobacillus vulcanalis]|uniref:Dolichol-phosphate mannosyltransferase n=1 Tax=Alicyclobacillus vulcanalis TaxID=252246 RepID=A0A1N7KT84_9BACL|nr:glycosyltransferase family 2 protein [Alicyclobacillus vulcanalis]SIS64761.1 dolichol-phosphate mannosyltransferase [Alicyclobacillus vulcanalis]
MDVSLIIPTYNEKDNIHPLVERIHRAMGSLGIAYEIWFVDDSTDDTVAVLRDLERADPAVHVFHREHERGLASAVVRGFERAKGRFLVVMDADLQHPPELLPAIYERLSSGIDVVIPSRFVEGGSDGGLGPMRKLISWTARIIGQLALHRLRKISDCTSGFFGLRRDVIEGVELNPIGWKILIEVLVKGHYRSVHEIAYEFLARDFGESKMSLKEQWNYFRHLVRLVSQSPKDRRFFLFCLIGLSGVVVNETVLTILWYGLHLRDTVASVVASCVAMLNNYIWNDRVTWRSESSGRGWGRKLPVFVGISLVGVAMTTLVMRFCERFGVPVPIGQALGIVVSTVWSYWMNSRVTWRNIERESRQEGIVVTRESVQEALVRAKTGV